MTDAPLFAEVLVSRAGRVAIVSDFLAAVTADELSHVAQQTLGGSDLPGATLSCLHVILEEEGERRPYAVRDLDPMEARSDGEGPGR